MVSLEAWAICHGVTHAALRDLRDMLGMGATLPPAPGIGPSEAAVQSRVRLACSQTGWRVWRNNVGACTMPDGSFVRYGLANDSASIGRTLKSSDLIGIRPRLIGPSDIGTTIGQFVSFEVKRADWHYTGTEREQAQSAWLGLVASLGGHARFVTCAEGIE